MICSSGCLWRLVPSFANDYLDVRVRPRAARGFGGRVQRGVSVGPLTSDNRRS
jgi:hypothetical protein